jgi:hypothetical protein
MKRCLLFILALSFGLFTYAQQRAIPSKAHRNVTVKKAKPIKDVGNAQGIYVPGSKSVSMLTEDQIGTTWYDLQSNASSQNRIYLYDDGTMGAVWTMGFTPPAFNERGTGYNYFDGSSWGPEPTVIIEPYKTGWPSYMPYGENGELFVCHHMTLGLAYGICEDKGTGDWTMAIQAGPPTAADISWPRGITTGPTNNIIHFISVTYGPEAGNYNGQYQAFLYSRSFNGGQTWEPENHLFEEFGPDHYASIGGDNYEFAEPKDGKLAFLVGESWMDLVLMKSEDDGDTWTKTVIWECPYPLFDPDNPPYVTPGFYCADGTHHLAFDQDGKVHVVFSINWAQYSLTPEPGYYWRPGADGVGYWNEDRPTFSADTMALNPTGEGYTELVEDYSLIGWAQDLNDNDTIDLTPDDLAYFGVGMSGMPQILIDDMNRIFVVYSSITEGYISGLPDEQTCRHLWCRTSPNGEWWGTAGLPRTENGGEPSPT